MFNRDADQSNQQQRQDWASFGGRRRADQLIDTPLSNTELDQLWKARADLIRNPMESGRVRFGYNRGKELYVDGKYDRLRLPHLQGKDVYELAGETPVATTHDRPLRLVDFGGGTGRGIVEIAEEIQQRFGIETFTEVLDVVDFDLIPKKWHEHTAHETDPGLDRFTDGNIQQASKLCTEGTYDVVCSINVLKHAIEPLSPLVEGCKLLTEGGVLLFSCIPGDYSTRLEVGSSLWNPLDVSTSDGEQVSTSRLISSLNDWNVDAYVFELSSLDKDRERNDVDTRRFHDMIAAKRIGPGDLQCPGLFLREGTLSNGDDYPLLHGYKPIGFILAEEVAEQRRLSEAGFQRLVSN